MQGREYNHTQLRQKAQSLSAMRVRDHARRRLLAVLGVMVVLATASALMVPAVTMSASNTPLGALVSAGTPLSGYPAQSFSESVRNTAGD